MKKRIVLILEVESNDDDVALSDDFIRQDLQQEINCASNFYDIISFESIELD